MVSASPQVSVVIPTYNYGRYVVEAVESVLNQSFEDLEVIVVDDGSTDDTRGLLELFRGRIRYIYQQNKGLSAARNTGIRVASGEYLAFLDSDDLWLSEKLALQIPVLDSRPEVGLVYADVFNFDDRTKAITGRHSETVPHPSGSILAQLVQGNVIPSPTPVVRRAVLDRVGLFDESLRACEDWDLWIRIAKTCKIDCVDFPLAKYRHHASNMQQDVERMETSHLAVLNKTFNDPDLPVDIRRLSRLAYGNVYRFFGILSYYKERYGSARSDLIQAVKLKPQLLLDRHMAPCFFISLLGPIVAQKIRASKRKVSWLLSGANAGK